MCRVGKTSINHRLVSSRLGRPDGATEDATRFSYSTRTRRGRRKKRTEYSSGHGETCARRSHGQDSVVPSCLSVSFFLPRARWLVFCGAGWLAACCLPACSIDCCVDKDASHALLDACMLFPCPSLHLTLLLCGIRLLLRQSCCVFALTTTRARSMTAS